MTQCIAFRPRSSQYCTQPLLTNLVGNIIFTFFTIGKCAFIKHLLSAYYLPDITKTKMGKIGLPALRELRLKFKKKFTFKIQVKFFVSSLVTVLVVLKFEYEVKYKYAMVVL